MAGANNKALKKAGMTAREVETFRATGGKSLRATVTAAKHSPTVQGANADFRAKAAAGLKSVAERKAALQAARQQRVGKSLGAAMQVAKGMRQKQAADAAQKAATDAPTAKATEGANTRTVKALSAVTKITAQARRDYADGHRTVAHKLSEAGWNQTGPNAIGGIVGVKGVLMVRPSRKSIGEPIPLRSILPPGAVVAIPGQGRGAVDYSRTSYYVRLTDARPHDEPSTLLRTLASARATIRYPR